MYEVGYLMGGLVARYRVVVPLMVFVGPNECRQRPWNPMTCLLRLVRVPLGLVAFVLGTVGMGLVLHNCGHD